MCHGSSAWSLHPGQDSRGPGERIRPPSMLLVLRGGSPESTQGLTKFSSGAGTCTCPPIPGPRSHAQGSQGGQHCARPWAAGFTPRLWVELCKEGGSALGVPRGCSWFRGVSGCLEGPCPQPGGTEGVSAGPGQSVPLL